MLTPLDEFMAKKANDYMARVDSWRPRTSALKADFDDYKRWASTPNGTYWSGQFAGAAQEAAADDCKGTDNADDTTADIAKLAAATIQYEVVEPLTAGQNLIERVLQNKGKGVSIDQSYHCEYHPAEGESDDSIARNRAHVADIERQIKENVAKWEKGCQTLKTHTDAAREAMLSRINPKAALVDGRKILRDTAAPGDPNTTTIDYKTQYPKTTDPASADPGAGTIGDTVGHVKNPPTSPASAAAAADPNAPQYGPFAKDTIDKTKVGGLGESVTYLNRNDKPPEEHKPTTGERIHKDISDGIDKGVDKLLAPLTDLRDRLGLGDKGFWEANEEAGRREWESFKHQMTTPPGADIAEGLKHNVENPGQYFGERLVDGGALMAGGPEGLLPRAGLEEAAAARLGMHPDLPSPGALHDTPAPTAHHVDDATPGHHPAPVGDHHTPTAGDHSAPSAGDHSWDFAVDSNGHYVPGSLPSYEQLKDLTQTDPNTAHFWSGRDVGGVGVGPDGSGIAERIAEGVGGGTLETTLVKNGVDPLPVWNRHDPASVQFWEDASRAYAENTNGEVTAVIGSDLRPGNIWQTVEIPRLMENPGVTKIVQIDPDTGKSTVIFSRDK